MLNISDIVSVTKGEVLSGSVQGRVSKVVIDSRLVTKGSVFVAIKGNRLDGHKFIPIAIKSGAKVVVVSEPIKSQKVIVICVKDTTKALGEIAHYYRCQFSIPVIAITGSAGKTTTKDLIAHILKSKYKVLKSVRSENNFIGVPLTLLKIKKSHQIAVVELGTNYPGEIKYLTKMAFPNVGILTNIGASHLKGLKSLNGVFKEKFDLVKYMDPKGVLIFNKDDPFLAKILKKAIKPKKRAISLEKYSKYRPSNVKLLKNRQIFFKIAQKPYSLKSPAKHNLLNAITAISTGELLKISYNNINTNLSKFSFKQGRFEFKRFGSLEVIDDTYNSNPVSLRAAIDSLENYSISKRKILICADMLELGSKSREYHKQVGGFLGKARIDVLITFGIKAKLIYNSYRSINKSFEAYHFSKISDMHKKLKSLCQPEDVILVKGSRSMKMERTVEFLKNHFT